MAHMIEGNRMAYAGATPWHGIGQRLTEEDTKGVDRCIVKSGLNWNVGLEQLYTQDGRACPAFATVRDFDRSILGVVGPRYQVLQNIDAFRWFQPFLDSGAATLHTAGCLDSGRRIWVLAHVTDSKQDVVQGDRVDSFILLSNSHDSTMCVRAGFTPIRVVCANTLAAAHGSAGSKLLRVRHTESLQDTLSKIRDVMDLARREFAASIEQYRALASRHINAADLRKYVKQVFNAPEDEKSISGKMQNILSDAIRRAEIGLGNDTPLIRGTLWAAYNGVTESLGWKGRSADKRMNSLWFGSAADTNRRALEVALSMAS